VLFLCFLIFPVSRRFRHRVMWWDWALAALGVAIAVYLVANATISSTARSCPTLDVGSAWR